MLKTVSTQLALASDTLPEVLAKGNTTGGTDLAVSSGDDITFADNSKVIFGAGSDLSIYSDGTTGQVTGSVDITGNVTAGGGTSSGRFTVYADGSIQNAIHINDTRSLAADVGNAIVWRSLQDGAGTYGVTGAVVSARSNATSGNTQGYLSFLTGQSGGLTESARLDNSGQLSVPAGVLLGGTAAANLLDDYEEGTFTPIYIGSSVSGSQTYTTQAGFYEKIGRLVNFRFRLTMSTKGTIAGNIIVGGLPFTPSSTASSYGNAFVSNAVNLAITAGTNVTAILDLGADTMNLKVWSATTGTANITDANLTNTSQIFVSGNYFVA